MEGVWPLLARASTPPPCHRAGLVRRRCDGGEGMLSDSPYPNVASCLVLVGPEVIPLCKLHLVLQIGNDSA